MFGNLMILHFLSFLMLHCFGHITFTNLKCQFTNKEFGKYRECSIKAVNRTHKYINIYCEIYQKPLMDATVNIKLFRKDHGYKPYLIDVTFDGCRFLKHQRNTVINIFYRPFRPYTNLNHSCPFNHDIIIDKFWTGDIDDDFIKFFPIPNGDYAIFTTFYTNKQEMSTVNTYVTVNRKN